MSVITHATDLSLLYATLEGKFKVLVPLVILVVGAELEFVLNLYCPAWDSVCSCVIEIPSLLVVITVPLIFVVQDVIHPTTQPNKPMESKPLKILILFFMLKTTWGNHISNPHDCSVYFVLGIKFPVWE